MRNWLWMSAVVVVAGGMAVALILAGVRFSPPQPGAGTAGDAPPPGVIVQGRDITFSSTDRSLEVFIPGTSIAGSGRISVRPASGPDGLRGWNISLVGAALVGKATIRFKNQIVPGKPQPLVGFSEEEGEELTPVPASRIEAADLLVETTHFSNWYTKSWDWLASWAKDYVTQMFTATHGEDPKCENEEAARANGITATGGKADSVKWCMGKTRAGATVIRLNNARRYATTAERSPGVVLTRRGADAGQWLQRLTSYVTVPSKGPNKVEILGPGETVEYAVDTRAAPSMGIMIRPSPAAYQATALQFAMQTAVMMYTRFHKASESLAVGVVLDAMDAVDCASAIQGITASADLTSPKAMESYLESALKAVWPCLGKTMEHLTRGTADAFAVLVGSVVSWLETGLENVVNGVQAMADSILDPEGFQIIVTVSSGLRTYNGILGTGMSIRAQKSPYQAEVSFQYPTSWSISAAPLPPLMRDTKNGVGVVSGTGRHEFQLVFYADLEGPCAPVPARVVEIAPAAVKSGADSRARRQAIVATVLRPPAGYGYSFPVLLTLQLSDSPSAAAPGGQDCPGRLSFKAGPVVGRFLHQRGFNSEQEALAYLQSAELRQIEGVMASLAVTVH